MSLREDGKADANAEIYQISAIWYILTNFNLYGFRPSIRTPDMAKPVHKYPHKHPHKTAGSSIGIDARMAAGDVMASVTNARDT